MENVLENGGNEVVASGNRKRVHVAFQGGGARGIAHVGALAALDAATLPGGDEGDLSPVIAGVAGTSAGAIMAALVAAGYKSTNILDPKTGNHLLKELGLNSESLTDLFTKKGWFRISFPRDVVKKWRELRVWKKCLTFLAAVVAFISVLLAPLWVQLAILAVSALVPYFLVQMLRRGLAPLSEVANIIDLALRKSPRLKGVDLQAGSDVTFRQLAEAKGLPLTIVATNLTTKNVHTFSLEHTPDLSVAKAVCASVCLPIIFETCKISIDGKVNWFVDGGVLSNLPIWTFDEARLLDPGAWTIGFSLRSESVDHQEKCPPIISSLIDAIVGGPADIHLRGITGLMMVPLTTKIKMLDFDAPFSNLADAVESARGEAANAMINASAHPLIESRLGRVRRAIANTFGHPDFESDAIQVSIAMMKRGHQKTVWPRFFSGFSGSELQMRLKPLLIGNGNISFSESKFFRNDLEGLVGGDSGLFACGAEWVITYPLPTSDANAQVVPVLLLESSKLTVDKLCEIVGLEEEEAYNELLGILVQACAAVTAVTGEDVASLGEQCMRAQLWT